LRQAETMGKQGDYIAADKELEATLQSLPDSEQARQMLADFKKREAEQIERLRVERMARPKKVFDEILNRTTDSQLFESHEIKTSRAAKDVEGAVATVLQKTQPAFTISRRRSTQPETFEIEFSQEVSGGVRRCVIVCGQTSDDETSVLFKVLEFRNHRSLSMQGLLNFTETLTFIPVHPTRISDFTDKLKAQLDEGVKIVTSRIQEAVADGSGKN